MSFLGIVLAVVAMCAWLGGVLALGAQGHHPAEHARQGVGV